MPPFLQTKKLRPEQLSVLIKITQPLSDSQAPESTLLTALPATLSCQHTRLILLIPKVPDPHSGYCCLLSAPSHTHIQSHTLFPSLFVSHPPPSPTIPNYQWQLSASCLHDQAFAQAVLSIWNAFPTLTYLAHSQLTTHPSSSPAPWSYSRCQVACVEGMTGLRGRLRSTEGREAETLKRPSSQSLSPFPSEC